MRLVDVTPMVAAAALASAGCTAHSAAGHRAPPLGGEAVRVVELPVASGDGEAREVRVLVDEPALKLVTIVLRRGTVLPEHHSAVPVTIEAQQGAGTVIAGAERLRIDATHAVVLAANVPHAVEPDPGTDLVLIVHHLGRAEHTESHE